MNALARRVYRWLLRFHPSARRGYATQMTATFDAMIAAAAPRGPRAVFVVLVQEISGLARSARQARRAVAPIVDSPGGGRFSGVWQDVRFALRSFRRRPAAAAAIVVTLALGIGANTAIVSLLNALVWQRLPFSDPDRLVMVWEDGSALGFPRNTPAPGNYTDWSTSIPALGGVAAIDMRDFNLTGNGEPEKIGGAGVTPNLFAVVGVQPIVGRVWRVDEDVPGNRIAVISYTLWQRRFGGDRAVIDRPVSLNGMPYTVVGVMPPRFETVSPRIQIWTPSGFRVSDWHDRGSHYLTVIGRLAPGRTLDEANTQLSALATRLQRDEPQTNRTVGMFALPLLDDYLGETRQTMALLFAAVGVVLLIACANVANLLLARGAGRARETATRAALGASRARIVRQSITESLVLSVMGGGLGLLIGRISFGTLEHLVPPALADLSQLTLDGRVLAIAAAISCGTAILFGLVPALRASRTDLSAAGALTSARGTIGGPSRVTHALVVGEIALATVLLVSSGLIVASMGAASRLYLGFQPGHVLSLRVQLPRQTYADASRREAFVSNVLTRVRALPGVSDAGYTSAVPLTWKGGTSGFLPEGLPINRSMPYDAVNRVVTPRFMETIGMTLRAGRYFDEHDTAAGEPVAIINDRMAREYWPGIDVVGRRFKPGSEGRDAPWRTIVGVVHDTYPLGLNQTKKAEMYFPLAQSGHNWMWPRDLAVRAERDPAALTSAIRDAIRAVDPSQPISDVATLQTIVDDELDARRTQMRLMASFALLALVLAAIGIYGVLSYTVTTRTAEIGVRLALGGDPGRIRRMIVRQGVTLAAIGLGAGLLTAVWATRLIAPLLFQVDARDPATFAAQAGVLAVVCLLAVYLPARRASRVDPLTALRN